MDGTDFITECPSCLNLSIYPGFGPAAGVHTLVTTWGWVCAFCVFNFKEFYRERKEQEEALFHKQIDFLVKLSSNRAIDYYRWIIDIWSATYVNVLDTVANT